MKSCDSNCAYYYRENVGGGYIASMCELHGMIDCNPDSYLLTLGDNICPDYKVQTLCGYDIEDLVKIANVLKAKGLSPEEYADLIADTSRVVQMVIDEQKQMFKKAVESLWEDKNVDSSNW